MTHYHLIGIGGTGLSAIARVLLESGHTVSGSDRQRSSLAQSLEDVGARLFIGHHPQNVNGADIVIRSSAVLDDNPEVMAAIAAHIPVLKRADFLNDLMSGHTVIAIAGTHGKTTTTAMIAWILTALGLDPSFIIGGTSNNLGTNAHAGQGPHFVIEADEYDRMFLGLHPHVAVVTNVEHDHPDCYPTPEDFYQAFLAFSECLMPGGILLACGDDAGGARLLAEVKPNAVRALSYGLQSMDYAYSAHDLTPHPAGGFSAQCAIRRSLVALELQVPGLHNVLNAVAALAVADQLGLDLTGAARALSEFQGTGRRFEIRGEIQGITIVDDYAHHPTEIRATLAAARARYPHRLIWAVWQPHTYSRTRTLFTEFAAAFMEADHVLVTEIYAARESPPADGFSSRQIIAAMQHPEARYMPDIKAAAADLIARLRHGAVLLVLSAGDADQISTQVLSGLADRNPSLASDNQQSETPLP